MVSWRCPPHTSSSPSQHKFCPWNARCWYYKRHLTHTKLTPAILYHRIRFAYDTRVWLLTLTGICCHTSFTRMGFNFEIKKNICCVSNKNKTAIILHNIKIRGWDALGETDLMKRAVCDIHVRMSWFVFNFLSLFSKNRDSNVFIKILLF